MSYLRNQRRRGYPRQRRALRDGMRQLGDGIRIAGRAASDAAGPMRDLAAAFAAVGWHGTDDPRNDPRDTYPGRYA